jgi:glutamate-1-semialdehyde 2,1-aminomutase
MTREPIRSIAEVRRGDMTVRDLLFFDFLERGLYMARRGMINLSLPIGAAELDAVAAAFEEFLTVRRNLLD